MYGYIQHHKMPDVNHNMAYTIAHVDPCLLRYYDTGESGSLVNGAVADCHLTFALFQGEYHDSELNYVMGGLNSVMSSN